jgi:predicted PurR-regulated permease PerM
MNSQKIEISYKTILYSILSIVGIFILWQLKSILGLFFLCVILMEVLNPSINFLQKYKIPRPLSIIIIYILIIAIFSSAIVGFIPILIDQTISFIKALPSILNDVQNVGIFGLPPIDISSQFKLLENLPSNITKTLFSFFSNFFTGLLVMVITFYMLIERKNFSKYAAKIFGKKGEEKTIEFMNSLEKRLGFWVRSQLLLMLSVGVLSYIAYAIIGLNYALPLAIMAFLFDIIPNIGPILAVALATVVALTMSPLTALIVVIVGIVIQQIENNILAPLILKGATGLKPVLIILILITGAKVGGLVGAVLAIPLYLTIEVVVKVFFLNKGNKKTQRNR